MFIHEIHHDNSGVDVGERVAAAVPSGTVLAGYTLVLYSGSDGASYPPVLVVDGVAPGNCQGYDLYTVAAPGLRNGAPDGIALGDNLGAVVALLGYEGGFVAGNGGQQRGCPKPTASETNGSAAALNANGYWSSPSAVLWIKRRPGS